MPVKKPKKKKPSGPDKTVKRNRKRNAPKRLTRSDPVWDLYRDGITQSALKKFMTCPEQFRIDVVEGWRAAGHRKPLILGSMFHDCLDKLLKDSTDGCLSDCTSFDIHLHVMDYLNNNEIEKMSVWYRDMWKECAEVVKVLLLHYIPRWDDTNRKSKLLASEVNFDVDHNGHRLRGRLDQLRESNGLWVVDTKLKGMIAPHNIDANLKRDFQLFFYSLGAEYTYEKNAIGIMHDIVRIPGTGRKVKERADDYAFRLDALIKADPDYYYMRFGEILPSGILEDWTKKTLDPLLARLELWWINFDPDDPWSNPYHYCNSAELVGPYGPCNAYEIIVNGSYTNHKKCREVFSELKE